MKHLTGLYLIADFSFPIMHDLTQVTAIIQPEITMVQYRDKQANTMQRRHRAAALKVVCDTYQIPLIINDDVTLAVDIDATGVHLGAKDMSIAQARALLGPEKIIGASCYQSVETAHIQQNQTADYVAFGCIFPSDTKPHAKRFDLAQLPSYRNSIEVPICAIGGIGIHNIKQVIAAGADLVAIAGDILSSENPVRRLKHCLAEIQDS